jgi:hypothetical protein
MQLPLRKVERSPHQFILCTLVRWSEWDKTAFFKALEEMFWSILASRILSQVENAKGGQYIPRPLMPSRFFHEFFIQISQSEPIPQTDCSS